MVLDLDSDEEELLLLLALCEDDLNLCNEEEKFDQPKICDQQYPKLNLDGSPIHIQREDKRTLANEQNRIPKAKKRKCADEHNQTQKEKKRKWVNEHNQTREDEGEFNKIFIELESCEEKFINYFHMSRNAFEELHELLKPSIKKTDTNWRQSIDSRERLAIFLRYLTTGEQYRSIATSFRVGYSTVSGIIKDVSSAICSNSQINEKYMPPPTEEIWRESETGYRELWNFPNCIGSIDAKHVQVKPFKGNPDKDSSLVLIAVVDPFCKFIVADVGSYGAYNDKAIFENSTFYRQYIDGKWLLPPKPLPGSDTPTPHVLLGNTGFILRPYLMRAYPKQDKLINKVKKRFNFRLHKARRVVRKTYDFLTKQWQVLNRSIESLSAIHVVKAACLLYNFVKIKDADSYEMKLEDNDTYSVLSPIASTNQRSSNDALKVRERFTEYFNENIIKNPINTYLLFLFTPMTGILVRLLDATLAFLGPGSDPVGTLGLFGYLYISISISIYCIPQCYQDGRYT